MIEERTLADDLAITPAEREALLRMPLDQRRRILSERAEQIADDYESEHESRQRESWQGGDIVEY
jgi:hypothetical protein